VPLAGGTIIGYATRLGVPWSRWFAGPHAAPRAWDYLFEHDVDGWVRMRLKSGRWIGGIYAEIDGRAPYTAGYPEAQDLFLPATVEVNPETGEFPYDEDGDIVYKAGGLLIRWNEVEYLQFVEPWSEGNGKFPRTAPPPTAQGVRRRLHLFGQGHLGAETAARPGPRARGEAMGDRVDPRKEEVARRKRGRLHRQYYGGYTSSGRDFLELNLPVVRGPAAGEKRGRTSGG
jgi:hypothetical protein